MRKYQHKTVALLLLVVMLVSSTVHSEEDLLKQYNEAQNGGTINQFLGKLNEPQLLLLLRQYSDSIEPKLPAMSFQQQYYSIPFQVLSKLYPGVDSVEDAKRHYTHITENSSHPLMCAYIIAAIISLPDELDFQRKLKQGYFDSKTHEQLYQLIEEAAANARLGLAYYIEEMAYFSLWIRGIQVILADDANVKDGKLSLRDALNLVQKGQYKNAVTNVTKAEIEKCLARGKRHCEKIMEQMGSMELLNKSEELRNFAVSIIKRYEMSGVYLRTKVGFDLKDYDDFLGSRSVNMDSRRFRDGLNNMRKLIDQQIYTQDTASAVIAFAAIVLTWPIAMPSDITDAKQYLEWLIEDSTELPSRRVALMMLADPTFNDNPFEELFRIRVALAASRDIQRKFDNGNEQSFKSLFDILATKAEGYFKGNSRIGVGCEALFLAMSTPWLADLNLESYAAERLLATRLASETALGETIVKSKQFIRAELAKKPIKADYVKAILSRRNLPLMLDEFIAHSSQVLDICTALIRDEKALPIAKANAIQLSALVGDKAAVSALLKICTSHNSADERRALLFASSKLGANEVINYYKSLDDAARNAMTKLFLKALIVATLFGNGVAELPDDLANGCTTNAPLHTKLLSMTNTEPK